MDKLFSIIVPVYNTEKYLNKCIDSILNQTINNYEIIIINDGSTDNSLKKLSEYKNKDNIKIINQENKGLSSARNTGLKHSKGDYIIFIDSDDYIDKSFLENINKNLDKNTELLRFQCRLVDESNKIINEYKEISFNNLSKDESLEKLLKFHFVENTWLYCYKKNIFNDIKFDEGYLHEDFGITPVILNKVKNIKCIDYIGYNYLIRENSIMNDNKKAIKKCYDFLELGLRNIKIINNKLLLSFISNSLILKGKELDKSERKKYYSILKDNNIDKYMLNDTFLRKLKKILFKLNYNLYLKVI